MAGYGGQNTWGGGTHKCKGPEEPADLACLRRAVEKTRVIGAKKRGVEDEIRVVRVGSRLSGGVVVRQKPLEGSGGASCDETHFPGLFMMLVVNRMNNSKRGSRQASWQARAGRQACDGSLNKVGVRGEGVLGVFWTWRW